MDVITWYAENASINSVGGALVNITIIFMDLNPFAQSDILLSSGALFS